MSAIVTTAGRTNEEFIEKAKQIATELSIPYMKRNKQSVKMMQEAFQLDVLVVKKERLELHAYGVTTPFFFHPNSAAFRLKRLLKGEHDVFLQATNLQKGDRFLDTTAGLCSDSIIAAHAVGELGSVHSCEVNRLIAYIVSTGLKSYKTYFSELQSCMRNVHVIHQDALEVLKVTESNSYDVVYMDPMFEEIIEESSNFETLRAVGDHRMLTEEWVEEAKRVASKRVVLKAHFRSELFQKFGFRQFERQTSKFHYGVIEL
ncbi:class I SAM-dependent methyltransferase [Psychrobacillus sp. L3]|uniref:class I SAM-dependent methyltransferase n=1 Tax=Psychrobacillus sp. L3 TaxID=3236891 RepID=UPI0036F1ADD1